MTAIIRFFKSAMGGTSNPLPPATGSALLINDSGDALLINDSGDELLIN